MDHHQLAKLLDEAVLEARPMVQLSNTYHLELEDAYEIQQLVVQRAVNRGQQIVGIKLGFSSKAKMEQMGVDDLIWGSLTDNMEIANGGRLQSSRFIHPRVEPEIAFRVKKDINQQLSLKEAPHYIDGVAVALEVIDSRYRDFKFSLEDVVADNCSAAAFVTGDWKTPQTAIEEIPMDLSLDGEIVASGNSKDILGNPWLAFIAATRMAQSYQMVLKSGSVILAGAATASAVIADSKEVSASAEGLGNVYLQVAN